ncbi:MAG: type II toxin-antitoxin system VapC family toxin [Leptolyngbya sp. SIOISBB]|nr:type II toxin-antitoxin system VapC family toxin [Leptolyngbya sp. SIOISBB]
MVIDSSALIAILLNEPENASFSKLIGTASQRLVSACSVLETAIVIEARKQEQGIREFDLLLLEADLTIVPFDKKQLDLARYAFSTYGKGRHPADLNMGDCYSYALSHAKCQPLLFKGADFSKTDVLQVQL